MGVSPGRLNTGGKVVGIPVGRGNGNVIEVGMVKTGGGGAGAAGGDWAAGGVGCGGVCGAGCGAARGAARGAGAGAGYGTAAGSSAGPSSNASGSKGCRWTGPPDSPPAPGESAVGDDKLLRAGSGGGTGMSRSL